MRINKSVCTIIGSIIGAIMAGIVVYVTGSPWSCLITLLGYVFGSLIGKTIEK